LLAKRLLARERDAVADALNLVDDRRPEARAEALALLVALEEALLFAGPPRVGLTGPPGAGKSTLLDALVRRARARDQTIGILAVDPSSPKSGGALLGDRVRVRASARDPGVFLRSLAARDRLGGLAESARAGLFVLAAAFDVVLIETVGVGQSEAEVASLVDTLVWVAQPGAGDLLQYMKAGALELPDVVAVNKNDLGPVAERTAGELAAGLSLAERTEDWSPPVVRISARDGSGLGELEDALARHRTWLGEHGRLPARRRRGRDAAVRDFLVREHGRVGVEAAGGLAAIDERLRREPDASGFALAARIAEEIEAALGRGGRR
jgi:LAO/AO transport system kinase